MIWEEMCKERGIELCTIPERRFPILFSDRVAACVTF
jgi:hypothetical protein